MFIFLTHATYSMKLNTMQLIEHNTMKATHAMPHETQPMPPIPPMQLFGCIAIHSAMDACMHGIHVHVLHVCMCIILILFILFYAGLHCMNCIAWVVMHRLHYIGCMALVALHELHCNCMGCIAWVALHGLHCIGCIAWVALHG